MSLMGTLAKVAIGYATARGVDKMAGGGGLGALMGGAQADAGQAQASGNPMADMMQNMMGAMGGAGGSNPMAEMMEKMTGGAGAGGGMDLQAMLGGLMGGGAQGDKGGLLSSLTGGEAAGTGGANAGLAGIFAALGGAAAMGGKGAGDMIDNFGKMAPAQPEAEQSAALMLRAMIQAAKSDGDIDEAERAKILETVGQDADADDIAFVQAQLAAPVDVAALAADTPDAMKYQVYSMSMMSIRVDTQAEKAYMAALADALGIDAQTAQMLNMQMGVAG